MNDPTTDDTDVWSRGTVLFVGPASLFSNVVLRTVETELNGPARRLPDLNSLRFSLSGDAASRTNPRMVLVHESAAKDLMHDLSLGADYLPEVPYAIAYEEAGVARALFERENENLMQRQVSLLPMNTNVTNWVRLLQLIESGGHYVAPEVMQAPRGPIAVPTGAAHPTPAQAAASSKVQDALTPREAEVLSMAAAGNPNKMIASRLQLSEHTVKLYMHRIIGKLGVKNRTEAAIWYHRNDPNS